ncbi:prepilin-type N-terminal cleavage/methylation domain-containing protein [Halanaerobium saccharolyticum]|uniref:prepilin-type N-terminal cleavage/methylation domain-containing protein n=1 Tax=Halanaerobium saccharolyticum TaxID=43595 RepID=UPI003FCC2758
MKNNAGFSLLEVIITISLAGAVLAVMSRTIKTGLEVHTFLADKNAAVNWTESVLEAYKNRDLLTEGVEDSSSEFIRNLEVLEKESLPRDYEMTRVEVIPFEKDGVKYDGLYKLKVEVDFKCRNKEHQNEVLSLLQK